MAKQTELQQTKNSFKFIGHVTRVDKENAFKQETATRGKREGDTYRSLRFGVKTSETNDMTVSMYDFEPTEVFLWNSEKRKANQNYKGERMPFEEWQEKQDQLSKDGYAVLQARVGLTHDDNGKIVTKGLPGFVASEKIFQGIDNGDSVVVEGDIRYSRYTNQQGKEVEQKTFTIKRLVKLKDVDFHDEKFEEVTYFEQEMVFVDAVAEKKEKKVYVTGRTIDYNKNFHDSQFVIDYSDGADGTDEGMVKLAGAFTKKFSFGDVLNVFGNAVNRVIVAEVEEEVSEEEDLLASLGGKAKPKHTQSWATRTYLNEMQITGVDAWDKKVYKETDFVVDELVDNKDTKKKTDDDMDFGGKAKKDSNPFDESDDDDSDDLPF